MSSVASPPLEAASPPLETFLKSVARSGLLDVGQLDAIVREMAGNGELTSERLADQLVKLGKLTRFQAFKLMQGASVGLVLGPYQVLAPLGRGGMGCVYLARDARNQALVALKVLPPKRAREEERLLLRFRREMEIGRMLSHPNLSRTYDAGVCQGINFIAMEFIPGKSLYRLVSEEGPLEVGRAARLFGEVCQGLEYAHQQGLIHRDLKPSNILVTPNDHAKVLDLGLAIIQGEVPADRTIVGGSGYVVGTMDYLAPEQAEDALKVDQRADIYSLGCTLYFALTGRPPFPGGNALQKIMRHYSEEPTPLHTLNPNVPAEFAHLVNRMMAKRPNDRFDSAERVARALKPWESGEPVRPMDERGDVNYQHAVAEIQSFQVQVTPDWVWQEVVESPPSATGLIITNKRTVRLERLRPSMPALPTLPTPQSQGLAAWFDRILPAALVILFLIGCLFVLVH